eukprot:7749573-Ditylum_brightwellii.AAC.1
MIAGRFATKAVVVGEMFPFLRFWHHKIVILDAIVPMMQIDGMQVCSIEEICSIVLLHAGSTLLLFWTAHQAGVWIE